MAVKKPVFLIPTIQNCKACAGHMYPHICIKEAYFAYTPDFWPMSFERLYQEASFAAPHTMLDPTPPKDHIWWGVDTTAIEAY